MSRKAVTIRDVAKLAGVSVSTASRAIGTGSIAENTKAKVLQAAEELHFIPNNAARQLTTGRSNVVAVVIAERPNFTFRDVFASEIISLVSKYCTKSGLLPFLTLTDPSDPDNLLRLLHNSGTDGLIVTSFHHDEALARVIAEYNRPTVFIGKPMLPLQYPYVDVDNYRGGYIAGEVLLERGCRKMIVIAGPKDMDTPCQRTAGFSDALARKELKPLAVISGTYSIEHGLNAMKRLLNEFPDVDGVFAHSDQIASGAASILKKCGKTIPDDVAVVGFDDFPIAKIVSPPLTTLSQPLWDLSEGAVEMLSHRLNSGEWKTTTQVFPVKLVRRESA